VVRFGSGGGPGEGSRSPPRPARSPHRLGDDRGGVGMSSAAGALRRAAGGAIGARPGRPTQRDEGWGIRRATNGRPACVGGADRSSPRSSKLHTAPDEGRCPCSERGRYARWLPVSGSAGHQGRSSRLERRHEALLHPVKTVRLGTRGTSQLAPVSRLCGRRPAGRPRHISDPASAPAFASDVAAATTDPVRADPRLGPARRRSLACRCRRGFPSRDAVRRCRSRGCGARVQRACTRWAGAHRC
jgi:hypothetical protein